jgi:adenosine deaminase
MDQDWLLKLPKIDLHCHLDGSMSLELVSSLLEEQGISLQHNQLQKELQVEENCPNLLEYLQKFDLPLSCIQTEKGLKLATLDLLKNAALENVKYLEVRFAPMSSMEKGLNCSQVIESVLWGIKEGEAQSGIKASVIVCAMRHYSLEMNLNMLRCAREYLGEGICALDLAGDEFAFPTREYKQLFALAKRLDMPFTIHSGECGSVSNVREAIELGAKRLGHGIALKKDNYLISECREKRIGIEMCPTSNFQTKAVQSREEYPLRQFLGEGLLATINTDNRTVSNTTVTKEFLSLWENTGLEEESIIKLLHNSVDISFASDQVKHELLKEMRI